MNLDSFHNEQLRIDYLKEQNNLIQKFIGDIADYAEISTDLAWPNYDGINPEKYGGSKYRICWVLKEAYDPGGKENEGGGTTWHEKFAEKTFNGKGQTWRPMIYITYSLLHDFPSYGSLKEFSLLNGGKYLTEIVLD
jgi:hypothetical protein